MQPARSSASLKLTGRVSSTPQSRLELIKKTHPAPSVLPAPDWARTDLPKGADNAIAIVVAIQDIGRQRKELLERLRTALQSGKNTEALSLARELCGIGSCK